MKKYYNLTKEEYKKENREFKKTYVGKQISNEVAICYIFMLLFAAFCGWDLSAPEAESLFGIMIDSVFIAIFAFGTLLFKIEKERMLKEYIVNN